MAEGRHLALSGLAIAEAIGHPNKGPEVRRRAPSADRGGMELDVRTLLVGHSLDRLKVAVQEVWDSLHPALERGLPWSRHRVR